MPRKGKRKSSFGRPSASDGAKSNAKYRNSQDDEFCKNDAKRKRITRYIKN